MPSIRAGAIRDFPFAELSPEDFHRLALHLLERDPHFARVENHGAKGSDGGVDLIANPARSEGVTDEYGHVRRIRVLVQVKRVKAFTITSARAEIDRLRRSGAGDEFDRYLLIASCTPSAAALTELRAGCRSLGIQEVDTWDASILTARLLEHRDLLEFFFSVPDAATWLREPEVADRYLDVKQLVADGHPLVLVVGSRPEFDFAPRAAGGGLTPGDSLRWLIENRVVSTVVAQGSDFSMTLGDLLPLNQEPAPPPIRSLWQPPPGSHLGDLITTLMASIGGSSDSRPVLAVLGCSAEQSRDLNDRLADIQLHVADGGVLIFDNPDLPELSPLRQVNGQGFLRSLHKLSAADWLSFHVEKVDFSETYDFESIFSGRPVSPGIARSGHWPNEPEELPRPGRSVTIADLPGTGKTASGFRIAHMLHPQSSFYLDLTAVPEVTVDDLARLVLSLERSGKRSLLLLDNAQMAKDATDGLERLLYDQMDRTVAVVFLTTRPFSDLEMLGGEIKHDVLHDETWKARRASLAAWSREHLGSNSADLRAAELGASNLWHFFYLLRGGASQLTADLAEARDDEFADIVWYMIAALQVFARRPATVRTIFAHLTDRQLWPLTVDEGSRGPWLVDRITGLLESRRIVPVADGFACRHSYEAFGVLRLRFDSDNHLTQHTFRDTSIHMFAEAMPRIAIPKELRRNPDELTKRELYDFVGTGVKPVLDRQRELEQALSYDQAIQRIVDAAWAELIELIESWPAHPLYWLFNRSEFRGSLLRFSPFHSLETLHALETIEHDGDAIDIEYMVKGLLAFEAHQSARLRMESERLKQQALGGLEETDGLLLLAERRKEQLEAKPAVRTIARRLRRRRQIAEVDETIASLEATKTAMKHTIETADALGSSSIRLPFRVEVDGKSSWTLEHSARWLEHHTIPFTEAIEKLDKAKLLDSMRGVEGARPLLLAHIWLFRHSSVAVSSKRCRLSGAMRSSTG